MFAHPIFKIGPTSIRSYLASVPGQVWFRILGGAMEELMPVFRIILVVTIFWTLAGCGGNPYLDASLNPAEFEGKDQGMV